jgi:thymidylate synthase
MIQYLDLLKTIQEKGTYKPAARENMPGTQSRFGYQFRHDLADGFPLLTTKKMYWKGVVIELLWFLRGDTNIKYLVDNKVNIWNEDAYNFYTKKLQEFGQYDLPDSILCNEPDGTFRNFTFDEFIDLIKSGKQYVYGDYTLGDCGYQYGRVWRAWEKTVHDEQPPAFENKTIFIDQIKNIIQSLIKTPDSRRHLVSAIDPAHDNDLALYWCHALYQFNCRPLTHLERLKLAVKRRIITHHEGNEEHGTREAWSVTEKLFPIFQKAKSEGKIPVGLSTTDEYITYFGIPKHYLDCQLYQRSADSVLGVPFNIASYSLLIHILCEIVNMVPGEFIHTFGDVHIYDNHKEAVEEQLSRTPTKLPFLRVSTEFWGLGSGGDCDDIIFDFKKDITSLSLNYFFQGLQVEDFQIENYQPQPAIKAELSTGLKK